MWHEFLVVLCDRCRFGTETVWGSFVWQVQIWDGNSVRWVRVGRACGGDAG